MGNIKKHRKKYQTPTHPWQKIRIETEKELKRTYGLVNKKEIWIFDSLLRTNKERAKLLIADKTSEQGKIERAQLLKKITDLGLLSEKSVLEDILSLDVKSFLDRRLQTQVHKKGLARSVKQARQFIVHRHIMVGNKKITQPSYLVRKHEEETIVFAPNSSLASADHPERGVIVKDPAKEAAKAEKARRKDRKDRRGGRRPPRKRE